MIIHVLFSMRDAQLPVFLQRGLELTAGIDDTARKELVLLGVRMRRHCRHSCGLVEARSTDKMPVTRSLAKGRR